MPKDNTGSAKSFVISVIMHVLIFTALFTTLSSSPKPIMVNLQKEPNIVKAKMVDPKVLQAAEDLHRQQVEEQRLAQQAQQQAEQQAEQLELLKQQRLQQEAVAKEAAQAAALKESVLKEAAVKEAAVKEAAVKEAAVKEAAVKAAAVKKITQEKQLAAQQLQAKKLAAAQVAAKAKAEVDKQAAAKVAAMKAEQDRISATHQEFLMSEVERYRAEIQTAIEDNRILSAVFIGDISCKIRIKLLPDGSIANVSVVETSGNKAYDEMSAAAVYKSAPFPMPQDQELYNQLRDIVLSFKNGEQSTDVF